jgi:hypothetical protein
MLTDTVFSLTTTKKTNPIGWAETKRQKGLEPST